MFGMSKPGAWKIGKLLQFSKYKNTTISSQQYKGCSAAVDSDDIGVLCSWFSSVHGSANVFQICVQSSSDESSSVKPTGSVKSDGTSSVHSYIPISSYLCTITSNCVQCSNSVQASSDSSSIMPILSSQKKMATAQQLILPENCRSFITNLIPSQKKSGTTEQEAQSGSEVWIKLGHFFMYKSDQTVLLNQDKWLNDNHVSCAIILLKQQFPDFGGLAFTLKQQSLKPIESQSLQILLIYGNHWVAASTVNCTSDTDILLYDSLYTTPNQEVKHLLAKLVHTSKPEFSVGVANVSKQSGAYDCGLFAIAFITDIVFGRNPCFQVYKQGEMREHFLKCIEQKKMEPFPISRNRRAVTTFKVVRVKVHCYCRCLDYGEKMVLCDGACGEWFHVKCIESQIRLKKKWYCKYCVTGP